MLKFRITEDGQSPNPSNPEKMVMFISANGSAVLGKENRAAVVTKRKIKLLSEQHCVARRYLGIYDD
jgi:hypothetical protein